MLYSLENPKSAVGNVDNLNILRASEQWEGLRNETTDAEFATMNLIREIFTCRDGLIKQRKYDLDVLLNTLKRNIPFPGLNSNDINWEILHAAWLTVQVWI